MEAMALQRVLLVIVVVAWLGCGVAARSEGGREGGRRLAFLLGCLVFAAAAKGGVG